MAKDVVLTGLRTNGEYHLGNYIGALLPMLRLLQRQEAENLQINLFAPDLHSFTTPVDFDGLYSQTMANLRLFAAAGLPLDDNNVNLYRQSRIPAHSELTWILSNFAAFGDLARMIEFKDKSARFGREVVGSGLFIYPVLMAADILLYDARWIPVGDDQRQHLEFCRRLAQSFNQRTASEVFLIPASFAKQQAWLGRQEAPRIRSLRWPEKKMSKSVDDEKGTVLLSDSAEQVSAKVMAATTDNLGRIGHDWEKQPGVSNLLTILAALTETSQAEINAAWQGGSDYKALKTAVAEAVNQTLARLQAALEDISPDKLLAHLEERERRLGEVAAEKLALVQQAIGLRRSGGK